MSRMPIVSSTSFLCHAGSEPRAHRPPHCMVPDEYKVPERNYVSLRHHMAGGQAGEAGALGREGCSGILSSPEVTMASPDNLPEMPGCRGREVLGRIGDKWSLHVIHLLGGGTRRFSELRRHIGGITPPMLTDSIRSLERER